MRGNPSKKEEKKMFQILKEQYEFFQQKNKEKILYTAVSNYVKRYTDAKKQKMNMYIFFDAEINAFNDFKEKYENQKVGQDLGKQVESVYERLNENIKKYDRIKIHKNASEEVERMLGGLLNFRKIFIVGLNYLGMVIDEIKVNKNYQDVLSILDELGNIKRGVNLPNAFNSFRFSLEIYESNEIENEKSQMEILKKCIVFFKKVKQLALFIEQMSFRKKNIKIKKIPFLGDYIFINEFSYTLNKKSNEILSDFRLEDFY